jgi:hypothetical protein
MIDVLELLAQPHKFFYMTLSFTYFAERTGLSLSVAFSPQVNYTDWATATGRRTLVPNFVDRGVSRGQRGGLPTAVILTFLERNILLQIANKIGLKKILRNRVIDSTVSTTMDFCVMSLYYY